MTETDPAALAILSEIAPEARVNFRRELGETLKRAWAPPPKMTVSEWADAERYLSAESSSEPGRWSTERVEPARGVMDAFADPRVEKVTAMVCTQLLKTEALNNVVGYHVDRDPAPLMVLQPTIQMGEAWSKDRLAPMLRDTPALKSKVGDARSRDAENTILHKKFTGGHITIAGANSPASLASRPIRVVLCDEVDRYPHTAGKEGDPVSLVTERTSTFWNRKIGLFSTPTVKGVSRIDASYEESDKRVYCVPCPHCSHEQDLKWGQVKWEEGRPDTAAYHCEECGSAWTESQRLRAIKRGVWRATAPFNGHAGFHLNKLASPWTTIPKIVEKFIEAKKFPETLKVWVNTTLAETWEEDGESFDADALLSRREEYPADPVPAGVALVVAGVDTQDDRLEVEIVGFGAEDETWSLDYLRLYGDPSTRHVWAELDEVLERRFRHPSGQELRIEAACIDSGGHHTQSVYDYCRPRYARRVFAIKGSPGEGKPIWPKKATKNAAKKVNVFLIGVDTAKDRFYKRLSISEPGPGYCHFPTRYGESYFEGLTCEKMVTKYRHGFPYRVWEKPSGARNEPMDCRVYAMAARQSLNVDLERRSSGLLAGVEGNTSAAQAALNPKRRRRVRHSGAAV